MKTKLILSVLFMLNLGINTAKSQTIIGGYPVSNDTAQINLLHFSQYITGNEVQKDSEKIEKVLNWIYLNMEWDYTDEKTRTAKEILKRGGGNCNELNQFLVELLHESNIQTRYILELSLQPESKLRMKRAKSNMQLTGNKASLCGLKHADTYWLEYWDTQLKSWEPIVAEMKIVGINNWMKAKLKFGERSTNSPSQIKKGIIPISIFVLDSKKGTILEDRTKHYLSNAFDTYYQHKLNTLNTWNLWKTELDQLSRQVIEVYKGKANLHEQRTSIDALETLYAQLKQEYQSSLIANQ